MSNDCFLDAASCAISLNRAYCGMLISSPWWYIRTRRLLTRACRAEDFSVSVRIWRRGRASRNTYAESAQEPHVVHPRHEPVCNLLGVLLEVGLNLGSSLVSLRARRKTGCADLLLRDEPDPVIDLARSEHAADAFLRVARVENTTSDVVCEAENWQSELVRNLGRSKWQKVPV